MVNVCCGKHLADARELFLVLMYSAVFWRTCFDISVSWATHDFFLCTLGNSPSLRTMQTNNKTCLDFCRVSICKTRIHSSRMRTDRSNGHFVRGVCLPGGARRVCLPVEGGSAYLDGVRLPRHPPGTHPWADTPFIPHPLSTTLPSIPLYTPLYTRHPSLWTEWHMPVKNITFLASPRFAVSHNVHSWFFHLKIYSFDHSQELLE